MMFVEDLGIQERELLRLLARSPAFAVRGLWRARARPGRQPKISESVLTRLIAAGFVIRGEENGIACVVITRAGRDMRTRLRSRDRPVAELNPDNQPIAL